MEMKEVVSFATQLADKIVALKEQGFTDISAKQVNDPNEENILQEQVLLDMQKDGQTFEVRLFSKDENGELVLKTKEGKLGKKKDNA